MSKNLTFNSQLNSNKTDSDFKKRKKIEVDNNSSLF
jgi:hypothetical protein